jgi:hypothetical protein
MGSGMHEDDTRYPIAVPEAPRGCILRNRKPQNTTPLTSLQTRKAKKTGKEVRPADMQVREDQKHTLLTSEVESAKHSRAEKQGARNSSSKG